MRIFVRTSEILCVALKIVTSAAISVSHGIDFYEGNQISKRSY